MGLGRAPAIGRRANGRDEGHRGVPAGEVPPLPGREPLELPGERVVFPPFVAPASPPRRVPGTALPGPAVAGRLRRTLPTARRHPVGMAPPGRGCRPEPLVRPRVPVVRPPLLVRFRGPHAEPLPAGRDAPGLDLLPPCPPKRPRPPLLRPPDEPPNKPRLPPLDPPRPPDLPPNRPLRPPELAPRPPELVPRPPERPPSSPRPREPPAPPRVLPPVRPVLEPRPPNSPRLPEVEPPPPGRPPGRPPRPPNKPLRPLPPDGRDPPGLREPPEIPLRAPVPLPAVVRPPVGRVAPPRPCVHRRMLRGPELVLPGRPRLAEPVRLNRLRRFPFCSGFLVRSHALAS